MSTRRAAALCRRHRSVLILLSVGFAVASFDLLNAQSPTSASAPVRPIAAAQQLPIRRVVLYKSGVGYFEHVGRVRGNQQMTIDFTSSQLDDVLKSLTALDLDGGRITNVGYNSEAGLDRRLGGLRLPLGQNATRAQFLAALRGARLEVRSAASRTTGRLLSVESTERRADGVTSRVDALSLVSDSGDVITIALDPGVTIRILDADLSNEVGRYLTMVGSIRDQDTRRLTISTQGTGDRDVFVSYVSEVPVWKATYRLMLPGAGDARKPLLQGWAIVDNTIGQDWDGVQMSLVAGAPQTFIHQISRPYYVQRPIVPLPARVLLAPQTHEGALATNGPGAIAGVVTDTGGGVVPGASIRLTINGSSAGQTTSDTSGRYRFSNLTPGAYQVTVTLQGFKTVVHPSVTVSPGMETIANAQLEVGALSERVTVRAATINGLPQNTSRLMIDGVSTSTLSTDAFSSVVRTQAAAETGATGTQLGDLFEYRLREPITIKKNQSALVPIAAADVDAETVSLWTADDHGSKPLRAVWLHNTTPLTLDGGSFSIVEGQAFVGEGLMEGLKPGERRLLSYASDVGLTIGASDERESSRLVRVKVTRGVVVEESEERQSRTYTIRNENPDARTLILEHPVHSGWKLTGAVAPVESTLSWHRFRVPVAAKTTVSLTVEEVQPDETTYAISDVTTERVELLVRECAVSQALEAALKEVLARKVEIARLAGDMAAREREISTISADQQRLRQNMQALKGSREERDLLQRYVRQLSEQETRLEAVRSELTALTATHRKAVADLQAFIEGIG